MAYQLIWAPSARLDLKDLFSYIAESRPEVASRFVKSVFQTVEKLANFPESGRMLPEFNNPNLREVMRKPCRIVYRIQASEKTIEIVRVWHAARGTPEI